MAKLEREPKDPVRKGRAELVRAATAEEWTARPGAKLEKAGHDGLKLVVAKAPEFILDAEGEIVGVDAWVQLFDERGRELPIDPHRRIINPPTVPRSGVRLVDTGKVERGQPVMERQVTADPMAAFWEAVWDSVEGVPNSKGWRTRGTVTTVFASAAGDGYLACNNATYSTARSGGGSITVDAVSFLLAGQTQIGGGDYTVYESFVSFDTSAIADADVVSAVALDLMLNSDSSTTDFTLQARDFDWGASLTTADWVPGANLGSNTLVATLNSSGIGATGAYKTFTSQAAFLSVSNIKTGTVHLVLASDRTASGVAPPNASEYLGFEDAEQAGTTQDPKLTITHAAPGSSPFFTSRPNRIWRLG